MKLNSPSVLYDETIVFHWLLYVEDIAKYRTCSPVVQDTLWRRAINVFFSCAHGRQEIQPFQSISQVKMIAYISINTVCPAAAGQLTAASLCVTKYCSY